MDAHSGGPGSGAPDLPPVQFGQATDRVVTGDFDGDEMTDYALFRPSEGKWYVRPRSGEPDFEPMQFGEATDRLVPGDYDGDRMTDYAVFRPSEGKWYVRPRSDAADFEPIEFGERGDVIPYSVMEPRIAGCQEQHDISTQLCYPALWPEGAVPYQIDTGFGEATHLAIEIALAEWEGITGGRIRVTEDPSATARLSIVRNDAEQNCQVGYNPFGPVVRNIPEGADSVSIAHELGHGLGLSHQHIRADRDRYGVVDDSTFVCGENYWDNWWRCGQNDPGTNLVPYDYESLMGYRSVPALGYNIWYEDDTQHQREPGTHVSRRNRLGSHEGSELHMLYAYAWGWRKFTSLGFELGEHRPLYHGIADGVFPTGAPALASQGGRGVLDLYTRGNDGHLYHYAVFRPSEGKWYVRPSSGAHDFPPEQFGVTTDVPVPGNYDGDGMTDYAVFRPSEGNWYVRPRSGAGDLEPMHFGVSTDRLVPGDWDGDGMMDYAVFRPSEKRWYVRPRSGAPDFTPVKFGVASDRLVPGDYDWDGKMDYAVYRPDSPVWPSAGTWYVRPSTGGADWSFRYGSALDVIPYSQ